MKPTEDHDPINAVRALAPKPPSPERVAAVREQLLHAAAQTPQLSPSMSMPRLSWPAAAVIITAVFAGTAWWMTRPGHVPTSPRWASVVTSGTSTFDYLRASEGTKQWVRLHDGRIVLDVIALAPPQQFFIEAAGAQIETQDSLLEVDVREGRLTRVLVLSGRADLRRPDHQVLTLQSGQRWIQVAPSPQDATSTSQSAPSSSKAEAESPPPEPRARPRSARARVSKVDKAPEAATHGKAGPGAETDPPAERAFRRGWASLREGNYAQAATAFADASLEGSPVREDATYWRAVAELRAGRSTRAEQSFEAYLEAYPRGSRADEAALLLGRLLWARGDTEGAQPWLQRASASADPAVRGKAQGLLQSPPGQP